jgi:hypothetical protein
VSPILLRVEEPPEDTVIVVRGGEMSADYVRHTARNSFKENRVYALSVFLALDLPIERLCADEPFLVRYGKVRFSRVARVRAAGFALLPTLERPHYDILLPDIGDATLGKLEGAFDPPVPNPGR